MVRLVELVVIGLTVTLTGAELADVHPFMPITATVKLPDALTNIL